MRPGQADRVDVAAQDVDGRAVGLDEDRVRRATRQRLEPDRAGAGEQVEHPRPGQVDERASELNSASRARSDVGRVPSAAAR